jgi:hypothetical protein
MNWLEKSCQLVEGLDRRHYGDEHPHRWHAAHAVTPVQSTVRHRLAYMPSSEHSEEGGCVAFTGRIRDGGRPALKPGPVIAPWVIAACLLAATGCSASTPIATPATQTSGNSCPATLPHASEEPSLTEVRGQSGSPVSLFGLIFTKYPIPVRNDTKIVWRMTGGGLIHFVAIGPDGRHLAPNWGPEFHLSSTWDRPGDEWGTSFRFPTAGCWTIRVARGQAVAVADVLVVNV